MTTSDIDKVEASRASAKVFSTFELLENILTKVAETDTGRPLVERAKRIRDLYRFQRVNSTFRGLMSRSKSLRLLMITTERAENIIQPGKHLQEKSDLAQRLLDLNPLIGYLTMFGVPSLDKWHIRDDLPPHESLSKRIDLIASVRRSNVEALKARELEPSSWRQSMIASMPTDIKVSLLVDVETESSSTGFSLSLGFRKGDRLGRFADRVVEKIIESVDSMSVHR